MCRSKLTQKISSKSVCWNHQNYGKGIAHKSLSKQYQEQGKSFSINEDECFKHQPKGKQQEKSYQFNIAHNFYPLNESAISKEQLYNQKISSIERQRVLEEFILGNANYPKQSKNVQKEIMGSIIKNLANTTCKKSSLNYTDLNTFQDFNASKTSNDQIFFQQKQENSSMLYQNSFSSLGTISEESIQSSQSSQYLPPSNKSLTSSSFNLYENEEETEQSYSDKKIRKESFQMKLLISCLVILTFSYLYLVIVE